MGWTETEATHFKANGKPDIKRELDCVYEFSEGCKVLKSQIVPARTGGYYSKVYYAAVKTDQKVWCAVALLAKPQIVWADYMYKDMDESVAPYEDACPASILKLLTPTDNEYANEWRARCWENAERKSFASKLSRLKIGSTITWTVPEGTNMYCGSESIAPGTKFVLDRVPYGRISKWAARFAGFTVPTKYLTKESVEINVGIH